MATKDVIGLMLAAIGIFGGTLVACLSKGVRDIFFVGMIYLAPMTENYDINFVSRDWYRGTVRGFEFSLVDILSLSVLLSSLLAPRRGESRFYWPASLGMLLLFFFYGCLNVGMAEPKLFGLFELSKMLRGVWVFLAVALFLRSEREMRLFVLALGLVTCYEGALALKQRYVEGIHRVWGTIDDSNSLSVFFCTVTPVFVAAFNSKLPKYLKAISAMAIPLGCVGVILTISRAGVVILGMMLFAAMLSTMSFRITARKLGIALVVVIGAVGVTAKSWKTLQARFAESSLKDEYGNKKNLGRGYYIRVATAIAGDQLFGVGLNNWSYWVSNKYGPRLGYRFVPYKGTDYVPSDKIPPESNVDEAQAAPAHSLGALTLGELGIPGFGLFTLLWMRWFQMGVSFLWKRTPETMRVMGIGIFFGFCGIFLQSLTEWVFRQSPISYVFHILLGGLASLYYVKRQAKRAAATPPEPESTGEYAPAPTGNWQ